MSEGIKVAVIGGGSTYTPELMSGLIARRDLHVQQIALMDISAERLKTVGGLAQRMARASRRKPKVETTTSLKSAVRGADFVLTQIRVGGMRARVLDERIPLELGVLGQETTGPGGFAKALRTVPVMVEIAQQMERVCPSAWLINFTNPSGIVTEAVLRHSSTRCLGLCNVPIGILKSLSRKFRCRIQDIRLDYVGLNHLSWVRRVWIKGRDVTGEVLRWATKKEINGAGDVVRTLRMIPNGYCGYYYHNPERVEALRAKPKTRGEEVIEIEKRLLAKYSKRTLARKPPELSKRGGAYYSVAAVDLMSAILNDKGELHVVNTRNGDTLPSLPAESAVEVNCRIGADGAEPLAVPPLEPEIRGLTDAVKAYEELTVEAAVTGDRRKALLALMVHPLVPSYKTAKLLLERLLEAHRGNLPRFFPNKK